MSSTPSLSASLWADATVAGLVAACERNGFVAALADGSLSRASFASYVAQDKFFLQAFAAAYERARTAAATAGDAQSAAELAELAGGIHDELRLHDGYAASWGVEMASVAPVPACAEYVRFVAAAAARGDVAAAAAAMAPCMRLYAHLGQRLDAAAAGAYAEWVRTYSDAAFEALAF